MPAPRCLLLAVALSSAAAAALLPHPCPADDLRDHAESLHAVPADAAFYSATLGYGEMIEQLQETEAWDRLTSIPALQLGWMQVQTQWQFPTDPRVEMVKSWVDSEQGQEVLALLQEMGSEEIFVYGDSGWAKLLEVFVDVNSSINSGPFDAMIAGPGGEPDADAAQQTMRRRLIDLIDRHADDLVTPDLVVGFKIDDDDRAERLLEQLETLLRMLLVQAPEPLADKLQRVSGDDRELLTMAFSADELPWDQIDAELEDQPQLLDALYRLAKGKQAVLAVGVVEDFVVVSLGDSTDHLTGEAGGPLLVDTEEFARLARHADEEITSIGYASGAFMRAANSNEKSFRDLATMGKAGLAAAGLDDERREAIERDLDELTDDLLAYLPDPGAVAAVSFATDRGYESFAYNWSGGAPNLDASRPLTLLDHLGEDSLGWLLARGKQSIEGYDKIVGWAKRGFEHFEAIAVPKMGEEEAAEYAELRDWALPLLSRVNDANRDLIFPAMADGQGALVLDASVADDAWCEFMPAADRELPLPTPALVYGVTDAEKLKQGAAVYWRVAQEVYAKAREKNPDDVPDLVFETPTATETSTGTIYAYELPPQAGASERVAPNAGLSDRTLVLSVLPELSEKLLAGSRPALDGPVAEFDRPLLSAGHIKFARLIDVLRPWIDYGIKFGVDQAGEEGAQAVAMVGFFKPQVEQVLDVLQVFDSYTAVTYREEGAWVTHGELRIIDMSEGGED